MTVKKLLLMVVVLGVLPALGGATDVYLSLSNHGQRNELGVAGFAPATPTVEESQLARQVEDTLEDDLLFSRYFNVIEDGPLLMGATAELSAWAERGAAVVVTGSLRQTGEDVRVTAKLVDAASGAAIWEKAYTGNAHEYRRIAHEINDDIVERFTGERGIARTRIAFTNDQTRSREIYIADYDGHNVRKLTADHSINILPRWSPDGKEIAYTTYAYGNPDLFVLPLSGARARPLSQQQGLNCAAAYAPDGQTLALTLSRGGVPHLYLIDRAGNIVRRLTSGPSNNTSPSFAPNGRELAFISDRSGNPQLYVMSVDGTNVRRLTSGGFCDSPAWSPRGDRIAFTMRQGRGSTFDIHVYELGTGRVVRLTQDERHNENPSWSPDGRFIVFSSTRGGKKEIYITAADGSGQRKLCDMTGASATPAWGL